MPITDIPSYVTTAQEFEPHWAEVNEVRTNETKPVVKLEGNYGKPEFSADVAALETLLTKEQSLDNALDIVTGQMEALRETLRQGLIELGDWIRQRAKGTGYHRAMPKAPGKKAGAGKMLKALDDVSNLWVRLNAATDLPGVTLPAVLRDGRTQATFAADMATLRTRYKDVRDATSALRFNIKARDVRLDPLRDRMVEYRGEIELLYGPDHSFTLSLPEVYGLPGSTPDPVTATGQWVDPPGHGLITITASTAPDLDHYEVRMSPHATYKVTDNEQIGTMPPGQLGFTTLEGLETPGSVASYKVFVVLATGNRSGSNAVTITRPTA